MVVLHVRRYGRWQQPDGRGCMLPVFRQSMHRPSPASQGTAHHRGEHLHHKSIDRQCASDEVPMRLLAKRRTGGGTRKVSRAPVTVSRKGCTRLGSVPGTLARTVGTDFRLHFHTHRGVSCRMHFPVLPGVLVKGKFVSTISISLHQSVSGQGPGRQS